MPTLNSDVKAWLENALLQLGAESYLHGVLDIPNSVVRDAAIVRRLKFGFNDPTHSYIDKPGVTENTAVLAAYNRMIESQANNLLRDYEIIDHHANDATGFSATLYRNRTSGEYTLSARSTEFRPWNRAGDGQRDQDGTNVKGIVGRGFAFAQLAAMEDYYAHLKAGDKWVANTSG